MIQKDILQPNIGQILAESAQASEERRNEEMSRRAPQDAESRALTRAGTIFTSSDLPFDQRNQV